MIVKALNVASHIGEHAAIGRFGRLHPGQRREERLSAEHLPREFLSVGERVPIGLALPVAGERTIAVFTKIARNEVRLRARTRAFELGHKQERLRGGRPHLIVVGHKLTLVSAAVTGPVTPVVDHIIEHVVMAVVGPAPIESATHAPVASLVVGEQVVMERTALRTTLASCGLL